MSPSECCCPKSHFDPAPQPPENLQGAVRVESRLSEGHAVVEREGSAAKVAQPVRAQVVPQLLHRSAEVGRSAAASELQSVRLAGSAAYGDRDELVGQGLVNVAAAGDAVRWGLAVAGWWAFAPARGRHELAAAEHVRSVVCVSFSGGGGKRKVSGGKRWLLGQGVLQLS